MKRNPTLTDWKTITRAFKAVREAFPIPNDYYAELLKTKTMRKYYPVPSELIASHVKEASVPKTDRNLEAILVELGLSKINLDNNTGVVGNEKGTRRLGKVLVSAGFTKQAEKLKKRNNSVAKDGNEYTIVISAHPMDVLTASFNRSWTSCMQMNPGYSSTLPNAIIRPNKYAMIAYLVKSNDKAIKKPLGRLFLNGYAPNVDSERFYGDYTTTKHISFFGHSYQFDNGVLKKKGTQHVFDISDRAYGKFPTIFRAVLSEIVKNEINKLDSPTLPMRYISRTLYLDTNSGNISKLRLISLPKKKSDATTKSKSNDNVRITIDDILFNGVEWNSDKHTYSGYYAWLPVPVALSNGGRMRNVCPPRKAHEILKNNNLDAVWTILQTCSYGFYQIQRILDLRPDLLKDQRINKYITRKGPEFALLVKNRTKDDKKV